MHWKRTLTTEQRRKVWLKLEDMPDIIASLDRRGASEETVLRYILAAERLGDFYERMGGYDWRKEGGASE